MKFLVTGGAGFIGSNLALRLAGEGHDVEVLDDLSLGTRENVSGIALSKGDARDATLMDSLCREVGGVFHDAAKSSAPMFLPDPREGVDVNIRGFMNVLEAARRRDFPVVYATTSSLYSRCPPPHREDQDVVPGSFYEYSMYAREGAAALYSELYGLRTVGLRYFSVYGPREGHKGKFANNITQFLWDLMKGKSPVVFGDGSQTRDFTYVDDVVEANVLAMKSGLKGEVLNVGTGVSTSFNDMLAMLKSQLGSGVEPSYVQNPLANYVRRTQADTTKARKLINFEAKVPLEEGIRRTVAFYRR
jgi:UDP-glucose 4-epimerase